VARSTTVAAVTTFKRSKVYNPFSAKDAATSDVAMSVSGADLCSQQQQPWALSVQKEGAKQPCPVPAVAPAQLEKAKNRDLLSSLRGSCIEKEQNDIGTTTVRMHQRRDSRLAAEMEADRRTMKHSFSDRYIRAHDGLAMKSVMVGDGKIRVDRVDHLETDANSNNVVRPAAGQSMQVATPERGLNWSPLSAKGDSGRNTHRESRRISSSDSVCNVLRSEAVVEAGGVDEIRQHLGRKRSVSLQLDNFDGASLCAEPLTRDQKPLDAIRQQMGRKRSGSLHPPSSRPCLTDDGSSQADSEAPPACEQRIQVRNRGAFKDGFSEFTVSQSSKNNHIYRYEGEACQGLRRSTSLPPERFDTDVVSHGYTEAKEKSKSIGKRPQTARKLDSSNMDKALRRDSREDLLHASQVRCKQDPDFAKKCVETQRANIIASSLAMDTRHRVRSASVSDFLRWE
jgi:hypothetical protein